MYFKQETAIWTLTAKWKGQVIYLNSNIWKTEYDKYLRIVGVSTAIDRWSIIWKSDSS